MERDITRGHAFEIFSFLGLPADSRTLQKA